VIFLWQITSKVNIIWLSIRRFAQREENAIIPLCFKSHYRTDNTEADTKNLKHLWWIWKKLRPAGSTWMPFTLSTVHNVPAASYQSNKLKFLQRTVKINKARSSGNCLGAAISKWNCNNMTGFMSALAYIPQSPCWDLVAVKRSWSCPSDPKPLLLSGWNTQIAVSRCLAHSQQNETAPHR